MNPYKAWKTAIDAQYFESALRQLKTTNKHRPTVPANPGNLPSISTGKISPGCAPVRVDQNRNSLPFGVLDETNDWIVVDKPAHMLVHPSKPGGPLTLRDRLQELLAYEIINGGQISIINRLDRETSGVTLVAKNTSTARSFSRRMEQRAFRKQYLAIVWGWPKNDEFVVDAPIARLGDFGESRIHLKQAVIAEGNACRTQFQVETRFERNTSNGRYFSLIRAIPETGRMHQIRVHLAYVGHPIVGDKIYGPNENHYLEFIETGWTPTLERSLLLDRHALHSMVLRLEDWSLEWSAPLPSQLARWIRGDP